MKKNVTIFQQNDTHGCLDPHDELFWHGSMPVLKKAGGVARINHYVKQVKQVQENVLFFDGGDLFHGTLPLVSSQGEALLPILQAMELDGFVPGNWDYAYGKDQLKHLTNALPFPTLACNVHDAETGSPFLTPYVIKEMTGVKVGVIGLTYGHEDKTMPKHFSEGLTFSLGTDEVDKIVQAIKDQVDMIVVVSHLGLPLDVKLARLIDGIDIILSGHSHDRITEPIHVNDTTVVQAGSNAAFLGRLDITLDRGSITHIAYELIPIDEQMPEDTDLQALITASSAPFTREKGTIVGQTNSILHRMTLEEAPMDKLITEAYLHAFDSDIAFSHGWRYGPPLAKGDITLYDLHNIIPTDPALFTLELAGHELQEIMEHNLEMVHSQDPFEQKGGYVLRSSGIAITYKPYSPKGKRIQTFHVGEEALDANKTYKVVGASAQLLKGKETRKVYHRLHAIDAIQAYLRDLNQPFEAKAMHQIITV